jgi:hypothetical protein
LIIACGSILFIKLLIISFDTVYIYPAVNNISTRERMGQRGLGVADVKSFLHDLFGPSKENAVGGFSLADYGLVPGGTPDGSLLSQLLSPAAIKIFYDTFADPELLYKVHYFSRLVHLWFLR